MKDNRSMNDKYSGSLVTDFCCEFESAFSLLVRVLVSESKKLWGKDGRYKETQEDEPSHSNIWSLLKEREGERERESEFMTRFLQLGWAHHRAAISPHVETFQSLFSATS